MKVITIGGDVIEIETFRDNVRCDHSKGVTLAPFAERIPIYQCDCCMASLTLDQVKFIYGQEGK